MTKIFVSTLIALTCATLHAQSVIVKGTGAGSVRGKITQSVASVLTNLSVTGTLDPDATGTNYVQSVDINGYSSWSNTVKQYFVFYDSNYKSAYIIYTNSSLGDPAATPKWVRPFGSNAVVASDYGQDDAYCGSTGTATVAYWYQTNLVSTVSVKGIATP